MPIYEVTDPTTGQVLELEGDSPPTEQELEQIFASQQVRPDFPGAGVIEPARAVASGLARTVAGGLAGTVQALSPFTEEGAGAQTIQDIQAEAFQPETQAGQEGLQTLNDLIQKGVDIVNIPLSGIGGILELVSGQGIDQAVETIKAIQESGFSKALGERVFEETGSPLAATVAETVPAAVASVAGLKGAGAVAEPTLKAFGAAAETVAPAIKTAAESVFKFQTPTKKRIAELLESKTGDIETARFRLEGGAAVKDRIATEAINQGFDEGVIAAIKNASPLDKVKMQEMVNIMQKGKKNARFAITNRPADIAGDSLTQRIKFIKAVNREAGKEIDNVARSLKGQPIDISAPVANFSGSLDSFGITIGRNSKGDFVPDFSRSELSPGDRGPIKEVIRQMSLKSQAQGIDAFTAHKLKRIIDRNVTFGKVKTGLSGDAGRVLKQFRRELDEALDTNFEAYNIANVKYSETINAINSVQDAVGRKLDFSSPSADKASGVALRRLMSNAQARANLIDSLDEVSRVVKNNGGKFDDDLLNQVLFVDELDRVFGPVARTSFQGQIDQALKQGVNTATTKAGAIDAALAIAGKVAEKAKGINEENAFKSIIDLLREKQ